jgi:hypothetical protein
MFRELLIAATFSGCASTQSTPRVDLIEMCRSVGGIDVSLILGNRFADCGSYKTQPYADEDARSRVLGCALRAQREGRAFIYMFEEIAMPDVDYYELVVFGTQGEKIMLQLGSFGADQVGFTGACEKLKVQDDGSVDHAGCSNTHPLVERLKIAAPSVKN